MKDELDFLCSHAKISIYNKRPFVTKKKKWSFHCLNCEQKFSSDNEVMTHYYIWDYQEFSDPISQYSHLLLCSANCVHEMLEKKNINLENWNEELRQHEQFWKKREAEYKQREIREKEDIFMKSRQKHTKLKR